MKRISAVLVVVLFLAVPVLADVNQKAKLNGGNTVEIKVDQAAWNYGSGNIDQDISVDVTGNYQLLNQDSTVLIGDGDYTGNVNNTMKGLNLIVVNLNQYGNNTGSGNIGQSIDVLVDDNVQILNQDITVLVG